MANRYWVGGTANWDGTAGSKWSLTSGGAGGEAVPGAGDDVFLDAASGAVTVTYTTSSTIGSLDCTGFTGTLTQSASTTMTMDGGGANDVCKFVAGMTYAPSAASRVLAFTNAAGTMALTSAGKTLGAITVNGAGTVQLQDNTSLLAGASAGIVTLTAGTLDVNNFTLATAIFSSSGTGTRTLSLGASGVLSLTAVTGTIYDATTATNYTVPTNGTIAVTAAVATSSRALQLGTSKSYGCALTIDNGATTGAGTYVDLAIGTAVTLASLSVTAPVAIRFGAGTFTITAGLALAGSSATSVITLLPSSGTSPTLALSAAGTAAWCAIGGIAFSTNTLTATNSFDLGLNSGTLSLTGPSGAAAAARVIGG